MARVTLYSRPGCRLCDHARLKLESTAPGVVIEEIDIDSDPLLCERYGLHIPVAVAGNQELFRHRFDPKCLELLRDE